MASRIQIMYTVDDGRAVEKKGYINSLASGKNVKSVSIVDVYTIEKKLSPTDLEKIANSLSNPLSEIYSIDKPLAPKSFSFAIETGFLPGVTDNVGNTAKETIEDLLHKKFKDSEKVYSSRIFFLSGDLKEKDVEDIAGNLHNPLIQRAHIKSSGKFKREKGMDLVIPKVKLKPGKVDEVELMIPDEELALLGKAGVPENPKKPNGARRGPLGMGIDELKAMRNYFHNTAKRNPTDVEVEALAQTWSEHCKHTIFANPMDDILEGLYKKYIKGATEKIRKQKGKDDFCVSVFTDNSGVIKFDEDTYISHKVETHNSPSALDPFGGAVTGIVGVNRDTLGTGLGAKPVLNFYGYCFADPRDTSVYYRDKDKTQELLSSKRIMEGVIEGVNAGGNQSGIPTPQGFSYFEKRYRGKPLVFVGTVGMLPKKSKGRDVCEKSAKPGDYIVMIGGRVGLDGIHGATFSSEALDAGSPATAVQIGDAITQKKLSDALVKEARDQGLYNSITDNGAGGLSSSVGEMARESGGCEVWLHKVPVKYPGLSPWQIWISESQERMTLAVPKRHWKKFNDLMKTRGTEATAIGEFNDSGKCVVKYNTKKVVDLDMDFMHEGLPVHYQETEESENDLVEPPKSLRKEGENNLSKVMLDMIARPNLCSNEFISSQYDHEVQGSSVTKPLQGKGRVNADATVSRPKLSSSKGVVMSQGLCPTYSDISTYHMAASSIDTAIRNAVSAGADPEYMALLDNFCWCSSGDPKRLWQLKEATRACYDYATVYGAPFISGKDSMFNDFKGFDEKGNPVLISVPPTLLISSISVIPDISLSVTQDLKMEGDKIYVLGETKNECGGSEYYEYLGEKDSKEYVGKSVPKVDAKKNFSLYKALYSTIQRDLVASAISVGRGGLGIALLKKAMSGKLGIDVDLSRVSKKLDNDTLLFSESQGRFVVSVAKNKVRRFEKAMKGHKVVRIGEVTGDNTVYIHGKDQEGIVDVSVSKALSAYRKTFKEY